MLPVKHLLVFRKEVFEAEQNISELRLLRREKILVRAEDRLCLSPGSALAVKGVCDFTL